MRFSLKILQPNKTLLQDHVDAVSVPAVDGVCELLSDHAPVFLALKAGEVLVTQSGERERWFITGGTCRMYDNECVIMVRDTVDTEGLNMSELKTELESGKELSAERRQLIEGLIAYQK